MADCRTVPAMSTALPDTPAQIRTETGQGAPIPPPAGGRGGWRGLLAAGALLLALAGVGGGVAWHASATAGKATDQGGQAFVTPTTGGNIVSVDVVRTERQGRAVRVFYTVHTSEGLVYDCAENLIRLDDATGAIVRTGSPGDAWVNPGGTVSKIDMHTTDDEERRAYYTITFSDGRQVEVVENLS